MDRPANATATGTSAEPAPGRAPAEGMVWVPGGTYLMGSDDHYAEEAPAHRVDIDGFWTDRTAVTNTEFRRPRHRVDKGDIANRWFWLPGSDWRHPRGPQSSLKHLGQHPVAHVAWEDADACARWVGKELPTEAEWERAARGRLEGAEYAWGDELTPSARFMANTWQGEFPHEKLRLDGYEYAGPVHSSHPTASGRSR